MALRRVANGLIRPVSQVADARISSYLCFSGKGGFEEKQHALEEMYVKEAEAKLLKKLLAKLKEEEKPVCEKTAKKDLEGILGKVPDDVAKKLMEWKKKDH